MSFGIHIKDVAWYDLPLLWLIPRSPSGRLRELLIARYGSRLPRQEALALCSFEDLRFHMYVRSSDEVGKHLLLAGFLEPYTSYLICNLLRPAATFLDIGANVGYFTILAALTQPHCRVVAVEPVPDTYSLLEKNSLINNLQNIVLINAALGDATGKAVMRLANDSGLAAVAPTYPDGAWGSSGDNQSVEVELTTVDALYQERHISPVKLVKVDVEGYEQYVFRGMSRVIQQDRPIIIAEMEDRWQQRYQYNLDHVVRQFSMYEYELFALSRYGFLSREEVGRYPGIENYVLSPMERRSEVLRGAARAYGSWGRLKAKLRRYALPFWRRLRR
ncbi:MAG: FkbM family methyltransferase [Chloroflexota bacterium]|nr:FkbM family methyltransferase [Dehalococcoidia bacterium]MDW8252658.1 FkbM family methyltransferase [Chloroflexota bacterium]